MGSKKKHERTKSRKKHKHKKHKKKKEKANVSDVSDVHESSEFEATASTQEALEQYDKILLALESEKDNMLGSAETAAGVDVSSAQNELDTKDANASPFIKQPKEQPLDTKQDGTQPYSGDERLSSREKIQSPDQGNSQSRNGQLKDRSQSSSKDHLSKSRDHQSRSEGHRSRSRGRRSRSRGRRSRSRGRRSRSRGRRSRSRGHRSRSRGRRSRSRGHRSRSRGRQSRSRRHRSRRRHYRSSSRSLSHGRSRSYERRRRRRSRSSHSRSCSPKIKNKIIIERVDPPQGSLESFTTLCQQLAKQVQELPVTNFPVDDENTVTQQQPIRAPFSVDTPNTQSKQLDKAI